MFKLINCAKYGEQDFFAATIRAGKFKRISYSATTSTTAILQRIHAAHLPGGNRGGCGIDEDDGTMGSLPNRVALAAAAAAVAVLAVVAARARV